MWGQLPCVQNAARKNAPNPSFSHCQHKQLTNAFLLPITATTTLHENDLYLFFSSTRLFYSWITFTLHTSQSMCQHSWRAISGACITTAVKYSPVKPQSWRSGHPKLHCWVQPTSLNLQGKKPKPPKDNTNEIYDKLPWKCQSRVIPEILFTFSSSFMEASKKTQKRTAPQNLPSCPQFTWPQIQLLMVSPHLKNLLGKLAWSCYFTSI